AEGIGSQLQHNSFTLILQSKTTGALVPSFSVILLYGHDLYHCFQEQTLVNRNPEGKSRYCPAGSMSVQSRIFACPCHWAASCRQSPLFTIKPRLRVCNSGINSARIPSKRLF